MNAWWSERWLLLLAAASGCAMPTGDEAPAAEEEVLYAALGGCAAGVCGTVDNHLSRPLRVALSWKGNAETRSSCNDCDVRTLPAWTASDELWGEVDIDGVEVPAGCKLGVSIDVFDPRQKRRTETWAAAAGPWHKFSTTDVVHVQSITCEGLGPRPNPPARTKYWVDTFANAPGYDAPGGARTGQLNRGTHYVFCKKVGPTIRVGDQYNHYWMLTDLDSGDPWRNQWVSAYYLTRWGNNVAKDNSGRELPDC